MPWTVDDVDGFKKGLSDKQKRQWVAIANSALAKCEDEGGENCEASAIRQANGAMEESMDESEWLQEAVTHKALVKRYLRDTTTLLGMKAIPATLKTALGQIQTALKKTWADIAAEVEPEPEEEQPAEEAERQILGDIIELNEKAVHDDGTVTIKLIQPGGAALATTRRMC